MVAGTALTALGDGLLAGLGIAAGAPAMVLSPFNLHGTLGLLALGEPARSSVGLARGLGLDTGAIDRRGPMLARLRGSARPGEGNALDVGYAAWCRVGANFQPAWRTQVRRAGGAHFGRLDFARSTSIETVNGWAARATRGGIPRIVDRLPRDATLMLAGAVQFAGRWATPFAAGETAAMPFRRANGSTAEVPMMRARLRAHFAESDGMRVLRLEYAGGKLGFWAAAAARTEDSAAFLDRLVREGITAWLGTQALAPVEVQVTLPRFTVSAGADVLPSLAAQPGLGALGEPLRGILGQPVRLAEVQHRARIRVYEEGTVASAATAALGTRSMRAVEEFSADRPFVFAISPLAAWMPLFAGYVADASQTLA
jgi:serpin B